MLCLRSLNAAELRAGIGKTDITPEVPVFLSGYASRTNLSQGVHDPLAGRAIALEQGGKRLVLVAIENVGFYNGTAEPLRRAILARCDLEPSELFLCATHTHSAPTLTFQDARGRSNNVAYTHTLERKKIVPTESDSVAAVLFGYATHSTSLGPRNYLVSGDLHGLAAQFLEKHLNDGVIAVPFAGASGDIDPWVRVLPGFKTSRGWVPEPVLMATLLGEEVATVLDGIRTTGFDAKIKTALKTIELPGKRRGETEPEARSAPVPITVTLGCLGQTVAFVGLGGEVFNEIGQAIKVASPFPHTFILTHCNGAAGYIPTRASYEDGGYEVQSSPVAPGGGELLADQTVQLLQALNSTE